MSKKRVLLAGAHSVIEPLGLLHLGGLARDMGWDRQFSLVREHDFGPFFEQVKEFKPDVVGFNAYTGNHLQTHEALKRLKKDHPSVQTVIGGPHATYFPSESLKFADFVVMSEGFGAFERILKGEVSPGIFPYIAPNKMKEELPFRFPQPDRATFYAYSPEHATSDVKSIMGMTGCPYACFYCYNSSGISQIAKNTPEEVMKEMLKTMNPKARLFPKNIRSVDDVVAEGLEVAEKWPTKLMYFQDDVHGFDTDVWMTEFANKWRERVSLPYHAQMRWEMTDKDQGSKRLDKLVEAGCFGLTLAIEAADPHIRIEVLNRGMANELMFEGMKKVKERGMKVRTEQITGLPYGATSKSSPINLDADLNLVKLNVDLRRKSGGPDMAWGSTFAPYIGTKLYEYCQRFGHYEADNSDVPDTFFKSSVLRFPKEWIGLKLEQLKGDSKVWLDADELDKYRRQNAELRGYFNFFAAVPEGDKLARNYLTSREPFGYERLGRETEEHLTRLAGNDAEARAMLDRVKTLRDSIPQGNGNAGLMRDVAYLAPMFASLPKGELALQRTIAYAGNNREEDALKFHTLSTAVRHSFYEDILYFTGDSQIASGMNGGRVAKPNGYRADVRRPERYPPKT
ncbi:MAG: cobalamin-dependent protein [Nanoarchaeota archaeon]|nr:cobalamin-dependent protein [Nanoarchaeota archaeon]